MDKLMMFSPVFWILYYLIASPVCSLSLGRSPLYQQHRNKHFLDKDDETLSRFSFAKFIANPCGLMPSHLFSSSDDIVADASIPTANNKGDSSSNDPLSHDTVINSHGDKLQEATSPPASSSPLFSPKSATDEALQLIAPYQQQWDNGSSSGRFTIEEQAVIVDEFLLNLEELMQRTKLLHSPMELQHCEHIHLSSLPDIKQLINEKGEPDVKEIYRALAFTAAHLHLINRRHLAVTEPFQAECHLMENSFYQQNIGILTGKVETLMCLIFPVRSGRLSSTPLSSAEDDDPIDNGATTSSAAEDFFQMIQNVLQTPVYHYTDCSARDMHRCLVVRYANHVFEIVYTYGLGLRRQLEQTREDEYKRKYIGTSCRK